jgi:hypothetical protein
MSKEERGTTEAERHKEAPRPLQLLNEILNDEVLGQSVFFNYSL